MIDNRIELLKKLKYIINNLVNDFTLKEFKQAGFSIHDLVYHGFNPEILKENDYKKLIDAGYTLKEITKYINEK